MAAENLGDVARMLRKGSIRPASEFERSLDKVTLLDVTRPIPSYEEKIVGLDEKIKRLESAKALLERELQNVRLSHKPAAGEPTNEIPLAKRLAEKDSLIAELQKRIRNIEDKKK